MNEYELYHHGIKGMKWGIRRYQNEDGTLTEVGKKRRNTYIEKETRLSDKKWNKRLAKSEKALQKYSTRGTKALQKGNLKKYKKYDDKYIAEQRKHIKLQAFKAIESEKIRNMSLSDISKEKRKIGSKVVSNILLSAGSIALSTITLSPVAVVFTPNVGNIKTNNRISLQEQINIDNSVNSMQVADWKKKS